MSVEDGSFFQTIERFNVNIKTLSKFLIFIGISVVFFGLWMDTTVSTQYGHVHNLALASQQQNMLILGGFAFMGGLVLFSLAKLKQSPESEAKEKAETKELIEKKTAETKELIERAGNITAHNGMQLFKALEIELSKRSGMLGRVIMGGFVGISFSIILDILGYSSSIIYIFNLLIFGSIAAFLPRAINWLLIANVIFYVLMDSALSYSSFITKEIDFDFDFIMYNIKFFLIPLISLGLIWWRKKYLTPHSIAV